MTPGINEPLFPRKWLSHGLSSLDRTPEDLTAIGIKKPHHRKKLKSEIEKLKLSDWLPRRMPESVEEMMHLLRLNQYTGTLLSQGYQSVKDVLSISIEDLEDIGFYMLGHQKRLLLGIKRVKELRTGRLQSIAEYHPEEMTMSSLPPSLPSKQSFSSFHGSPGWNPSSESHQDSQLDVSGKTSGSSEWFPAPPDQSDPVLFPDMPSPMEPFNPQIYQTFRPPPVQAGAGPPPVFNIHGVTQQNVEIPKSSPSIWQKFPSIQDGVRTEAREVKEPDVWVQRTGQLCGSLPRPTATVKPLSLVPGDVEVSDDTCSDYNMPFANERLGTIRLKTSPQEAPQEQESCDSECSPRSGKNLLRTPTRAQGRTATDVMDDISCMLADLTDELDSMLSSESVAQSP